MRALRLDEDPAGRGRPRHVVQLGAMAVRDDGVAGRYEGSAPFLPDDGARHGLRHHLLLGRAHGHDGAALRRRRAVP